MHETAETSPYVAPVREIEFVLHELLDVERQMADWGLGQAWSRAAIDGLLGELAEFAQRDVAALNAVGDAASCKFSQGRVRTPPGFRQAYDVFCAQGLAGLAAQRVHGGRDAPAVLANIATEILGSANHAWLMYSSMSRGAYECIRANGTPVQQAAFLPKLASGRWTGSMCITEVDAGTDVGLIRTRAARQEDGRYRINGLKRMATNAEHDLSENILHLVLARIDGAPGGSRGLSLFVVPKFLPVDGGVARNAALCEGIEDKMGIRGTPTCWMRFEDAVGELIGSPDHGLAAMFVMMNAARLGTGMQGVNQGERALQLSRAHALRRRQGRSMRAAPAAAPASPDPLIAHADVRRMLMAQKAWTEGGRAFVYWVALQVDAAQFSPNGADRGAAAELVALLTPVLKAFLTDNGFLATVLGQQVLGGIGYLRASGASQFVADARVGQIYEGANGIQGIDLLGRKVLADGGARLGRLLALVTATCDEALGFDELAPMARPTLQLAQALDALTQELLPRAALEPDMVGAAAHGYLRLVGHLVLSWFWLRMAQVALPRAGSSGFHRAKLATAHFYFAHLHPEVHPCMATVRAPASVLMDLPAEDF